MSSYLNMRQLNALWVLGWALVRHIVTYPFVGRRVPGPWLKRIAAESLGAVPRDGWDLFASTSNCLNCGLCDVVGTVTDRPSQWLAGIGRQPGDAPLALDKLQRLEVLAPEIEKLCPQRVKVSAFVTLVRGNHGMLSVR